VGRILTNCLVVLSLIIGVWPAGAVVLRELSERSTEPETPVEREEAVARSAGSREASKRGGKPRLAEFPGPLTIITAVTKTISLQTIQLAPTNSAPPHLRQLYGVLRI